MSTLSPDKKLRLVIMLVLAANYFAMAFIYGFVSLQYFLSLVLFWGFYFGWIIKNLPLPDLTRFR